MSDGGARDRAVGDILAASAELVRLIRRLRTSPFAELHLGGRQIDALFVLARATEPLTPSALAAALNVTPGAVTQLLEPIVDAGLVAKAAHPSDARSRILVLETQAAERIAAFEADVRAELAQLFDGVSDEQLGAVAAVLSGATARP